MEKILPLLLTAQTLQRRREAARKARVRRFRRQQQRERFLFAKMAVGLAVFYSRCYIERTVSMKDRSCDWWDRIVYGSFSDQQWRENFRMSRATFNYLCCELRGELERKSTRMRSAVIVEAYQRPHLSICRYYATICHADFLCAHRTFVPRVTRNYEHAMKPGMKLPLNRIADDSAFTR